jgi:CHAT domain-containing protein/tetratricopeptide (TPR) repeat protein
MLLNIQAKSQCNDQYQVINNIASIEKNNAFSDFQKLKAFYDLKKNADQCKLNSDTVYVNILERISNYEFKLKNYGNTLSYALLALKINKSAGKYSSTILAIKIYSILGHYYDQLLLFKKALAYYDSTIDVASNIPSAVNYLLDARVYKAYIYFRMGDFQKGVDESTLGLHLSSFIKDTVYYIRFLNQRAQSLFYQNDLQQANFDEDNAIKLAVSLSQTFQLASAYKTKALTAAKQQNFPLAEELFKTSVDQRILSKRYEVVASDYNDFGNFYRDSLHLYIKAKDCYFKAISYASKANDSVRLGMININLTRTFIYEHNYKEAEQNYLKEMQFLRLHDGDNFLYNPPASTINLLGNKHVIIRLLEDKTELLLREYGINENAKYLSTALQTARLTDSIITQTQHEQTGEQTKLYWRNETRQFYATVIEACCYDNNPTDAFFFMEKSRAVLLNDKLNEIDASSYLSKPDADKEEIYLTKILELQQKLSVFADTSKQYQQMQVELANVRNKLDVYDKYLEQQYPVYYEYKYLDSIPSLTQLQIYLAKTHQSFVHYFIGNTATYILGITANSTKLIRLSQKEFNKDHLAQFLQLCSNKSELNRHYDVFAALSDSIYATIFQPLNLPKGRTVICMDNIVIPFEALCTDTKGKDFLLNDHSFDYVYSARFLMKQFNNTAAAKGNFAGFAPVSFNSDLKVAELTNAATALQSSSSYYSNDKLFTHANATRDNFFKCAAAYSIVNIFSHAKADATDNEPVLYMQDSIIHLSELQRLNNPATKFVLLSACQTNVGKTATGEGIYSLARGFAAAGIPSVSATLWNADEETIYAISDSFNKYLSEGMNKDEALQKAKLDFINNNDKDKSLPYYWANMILIGNVDAIKLNSSSNNYIWLVITAIVLLICTIILLRKRSISHNHKS